MIPEDVIVLSDTCYQPLGWGNEISPSKHFSVRAQEHLAVLGKWKDIKNPFFLLIDFPFYKKKVVEKCNQVCL